MHPTMWPVQGWGCGCWEQPELKQQVLCPPGDVCDSERASSASGVGKGPWCHCRQMAAGSHRSLPRQVDANPCSIPHSLPPCIPRAAMATGPSMAAQPVHWRGLSAARSPFAPVPSLRAVPSENTSLHMGFHRRFPRRGTKWSHVTAELILPLSPPALPSAGDSPAAVLGAGTHQPSPARC